MHLRQIHLSSFLIAIFLSGCVTSVSTNIKPTNASVAKYNDLSTLEAVATLEKSVKEAEISGMPFLAPNYFGEAAQVLKECQSALTGKTKEVVVNTAAKGDAILEKGSSIMAIIKYRFAKELEFKAQLDEQNAPRLVPREYATVIGELSRLMEKVEREQPDNIDKDKETLLKSMSELVIKAVQVDVLRESELINDETKKSNAEKQAPLTYFEALRVYQDSKNGIAASHQDQVQVKRLGAAALFAARHAQYVNERVAMLQNQLKISTNASAAAGGPTSGGGNQPDAKSSGTERITVEKIVLQEEERLLGISTALRLKDLRDQPLEKQVAEIRRAAADAALQPNGQATIQDYEARLEAANNGIQQGLAELVQKDKQLAEKDKQLVEKDKQLADKDRQPAEKDKQLVEKDRQLAEKDKQLTDKDKQLADKNAQIKTLKNKLLTMKLM